MATASDDDDRRRRADAEGPAHWCYDALERREWGYEGRGILTLLRGLELAWITFDGGPAVFANMVEGEQALEDFLVGPPAVVISDELYAGVRAHVLAARTPGRSTLLTLDAQADLAGASWTVDGLDPLWCRMPGPESAGCYGGGSPRTRRGFRALTRAGAVEVVVRGSVRTDPHRFVPLELRHTLDVAPHVSRHLRVVIDGVAPPTAHLEIDP